MPLLTVTFTAPDTCTFVVQVIDVSVQLVISQVAGVPEMSRVTVRGSCPASQR